MARDPASSAAGTRDWKNYRVSSQIVPCSPTHGDWRRAFRPRRYYALMFDKIDGGRVKLIKREPEIPSGRCAVSMESTGNTRSAASQRQPNICLRCRKEDVAVLDTEDRRCPAEAWPCVDTGSIPRSVRIGVHSSVGRLPRFTGPRIRCVMATAQGRRVALALICRSQSRLGHRSVPVLDLGGSAWSM